MSATAADLIAALDRALSPGGRFWVDQSTRMQGDRFVCGECGKEWPTAVLGPPFEHQRCSFWNPGCNGLITAIWDVYPGNPARRREPTEGDELKTALRITRELDKLDPTARVRVVRWLGERYAEGGRE